MYPLLSTSISWHEDSHVELDVLNKRSMQNVKFGNTSKPVLGKTVVICLATCQHLSFEINSESSFLNA